MEIGRLNEQMQILSTRFQQKRIPEETRTFFHIYRRRGWIYSFFSLLFLAIPVYMFLKAMSSFSLITFVDLFLCLLLSLPWVVIPALFVFLNSRGSTVKLCFAWTWVVLAAVVCVFWGIALSTWLPTT